MALAWRSTFHERLPRERRLSHLSHTNRLGDDWRLVSRKRARSCGPLSSSKLEKRSQQAQPYRPMAGSQTDGLGALALTRRRASGGVARAAERRKVWIELIPKLLQRLICVDSASVWPPNKQAIGPHAIAHLIFHCSASTARASSSLRLTPILMLRSRTR